MRQYLHMKRVRTIRKLSLHHQYEKYNYLCIFKSVKRNIRNFINKIFNPELYPHLQNNIPETLLTWKNSIFEKYMHYIEDIQFDRVTNNFDENIFQTMVFEKAINIIGFTIWYGYKLKFPKKLTKQKFSKTQCSKFLETSQFFCNHLFETLRVVPNFRNQKYILFILYKLNRIFN